MDIPLTCCIWLSELGVEMLSRVLPQVRYGKGPALKIEQNFETLQNDSRLLY